MNLGPRWRKIWRDLFVHRGRTALVVLSIGVGVIAIGITGGTRHILAKDLAAAYAAINPASATIQTFSPFSEQLVEVARQTKGVRDAEGRTGIMVRLRVGDEDWRNVQLVAVPDYEQMRIDKVRPGSGAWPPPDRGILIERSGLALLGAHVGDTVRLKFPGQPERSLRVAGTAHDMYALLYTLDGVPWVFINQQTLRWLGGPSGITELRIVAKDPSDREAVERIANKLRDRIERTGTPVMLTSIPEPGKHPLDSTIQAVLLVLASLGVLSLLLGALLVTNTVSALLGEEIRSIGVMKAIGAQRGQLAVMYLSTVLLYGAIALALAMPLSFCGTRLFASYMASLLNFDLSSPRMPGAVVASQVLVSLVVPLLAALQPVVAGTRVTVQEAIGLYGLGKGRFGRARLDRILERIRFLPRPLTLSLRNTFRRKGRLALTVATLGTGSLIVLSILNVRAAALVTLDSILRLWGYDLMLQFTTPRRSDVLLQEALRVPGVEYAEPWGWGAAHWPDTTEVQAGSLYGFLMPIFVFAPPADTRLLAPTIVAGRWLLPNDENALVVNTKLMTQHGSLAVGDSLRLKMVGVVRDVGLMPLAYANYRHYAGLLGQSGRASTLAIKTTARDLAGQRIIGRALEEHLGRLGVPINLISFAHEERAEAQQLFQIVLILLWIMACVVALVGGLGLMGAMALNVIERTREIGVMRAIGAMHLDLVRIFVTEGLIVGLLSYAIGIVASLPVSAFLAARIGRTFLDAPLPLTFDGQGAVVWLALVLVVSGAASLWPAWRAAQISVRESLAYE